MATGKETGVAKKQQSPEPAKCRFFALWGDAFTEAHCFGARFHQHRALLA